MAAAKARKFASDSKAMITTSWTEQRRKSLKPQSAPALKFPAPFRFPPKKKSSPSFARFTNIKTAANSLSREHTNGLNDILRPSNKTVEALTGLELPAGVDIEIKL